MAIKTLQTTTRLRKSAKGFVCALAVLGSSFASPLARAEMPPTTPAPSDREKAAAALAEGGKARLWIACYLGQTLRAPAATFRAELLAPLLDRLGVTPTAFLSGWFAPGFLDFFMEGSSSLWACDGVPKDPARGGLRMAELRCGSRSVAFWGTPTLDEYMLIGGPYALTRMLLAPSAETRIVIGRYGGDGRRFQKRS